MPTSVAIADDHYLLAQALADFIGKFENYEVLYVAEHGLDLLDKLKEGMILKNRLRKKWLNEIS